MRYQELGSFEKHLRSSAPLHLAKIYLLISEEKYDRQLALEQLLNLLVPSPQQRSMTVVSLNLPLVGTEALGQELSSYSFFSKQRVFVIEGLEKLKAEELKRMLPHLTALPQGVTLIFEAAQVKSNTVFYKAVEKEGVILDLSAEVKPWEKEKRMQDWLREKAQQQHKILDAEAAKCMTAQLGTERALLAHELDKVITYCGERSSVTSKDIQAVCSTINQETGWKLGEAIFQRHVARALEIAKALLDDGIVLLVLLRQLRSQFQVKMHIASILARGGSTSDVNDAYGYMRGQILDQNIRLVKSYGFDSLRQGLIGIDEAEVEAKNSSTDPDLIAEILIIKLAS